VPRHQLDPAPHGLEHFTPQHIGNAQNQPDLENQDRQAPPAGQYASDGAQQHLTEKQQKRGLYEHRRHEDTSSP
jgi:hypothetical protein